MIKDLEKTIGYQFRNITLLQNALTHSSYANERWHDSLKSNERLEFLGDSILGMVVAEHLYRNYPNRPEGELSRMRADMVCETSLARVADQLCLGEHMLLGHGEQLSGGKRRASILADAVESIIAASFLDGGMAPARQFIGQFILTHVPEKHLQNADYKTTLQELVQQKKDQVIAYELISETGPDHDKHFCVQVLLNGRPIGVGEGSSKKRAEQDAAHHALDAAGVSV